MNARNLCEMIDGYLVMRASVHESERRMADAIRAATEEAEAKHKEVVMGVDHDLEVARAKIVQLALEANDGDSEGMFRVGTRVFGYETSPHDVWEIDVPCVAEDE